MKLLHIFIFVFALLNITNSHLLPEDSVSDDAEQINREKRDSFLDSILKTIPFFNMSPSQSMNQDDEPIDPNDIDGDDLEIKATPTAVIASTVAPEVATSSIVLSATVVPTATSLSTKSSINFIDNVIVLKTPTLTSTSPMATTYSILSPYASASLLSMFTMTSTPSALETVVTTAIKPSQSQISLTYATASSVAGIMPTSTLMISPSSAQLTAVSPSAKEMTDPVIKMMIMSAENSFRGKLPDEKGFGDSLVDKLQSNVDESEIKNIRFLYTNILIPVMSGVFGALLITFGVLIYKCIRRKKLQKVRYYGGKPNSSLYRLDQMSLLSDTMSSDEE